jgi:pyrroline-5-carboxylate reductase
MLFEIRVLMKDTTSIAFIGSGMMAEAMIVGLLKQKRLPAQRIITAGPRSERGEQLAKKHGVHWTTNNAQAADGRQVVVLSVKPQKMATVLSDVCGHVPADALVLSIAAGVSIATITNGLDHPAVVRAMPNTPGQIGQGITMWTATPKISEEQKQQTRIILGALGEEIFSKDEDDMDKATALSGTGPAYIFLFMEAMIDAGVHLGFSRRVAQQLVLQTMAGAVEFAKQSHNHPAELRNQVTSPGGTSAEALYHMEKGGLRTVVSRSIWAAYQRSKSLGGSKQAEIGEKK